MDFRHKFQMNLFSVASLGIGAMVGAGIFALLGQVILQAASWTYASFIISGLAAVFCGYSYAKLATYLPKSGGITAYYSAAFPSKWVAGSLSLIYLFTLMISIAMLAKSFALYVLGLMPDTATSSFNTNLIALGLISALTLLNLQSSGKVGKAEVILVGSKLIILLALIIGVILHSELKYFNHPVVPSASSFMGSIGITFFAYAGFGMMVNAAKDVSQPNRTITHAIYMAIFIVILLYLSLTYVVLNYIPTEEIAKTADTAIAVVAGKIWGDAGRYVLSFAALIAFISGINAMFFSSYKIIEALSTQHILPVFCNKKISQDGTIGELIASLLILGAIATFDFTDVVNLSSGAFLVSYLAVLFVNWKLRKETKSLPIAILFGLGIMAFILVSFIVSLMN